jgi:dTDP-4-dehydrorhamnose 3,5-epimerase
LLSLDGTARCAGSATLLRISIHAFASKQMIFSETKLLGAYTVDIDRRQDKRGHFARLFCEEEFSGQGLKFVIAQASISFNKKRGTLRGLHFQYPPAAETKYVRCTKGAICDVIVDLRPESLTYLKHLAVHLSAENGRGLYVPGRFAHGFVTLEDDTELTYLIGESHTPSAEGGLRYDDPALALDWPLPVRVISERDTAWKPITEIESELKSRMSINQTWYG